MAINSHPPNSPDWWRYYLVQKLMDRQYRYDTLEDYHLGNHPLPPGDARYVKDLKRFQEMSRTNYISLVNEAPVGRMRVKGFQFGEESTADKDAKMIWAANDMDLQSKKLHSASAVFGDCYVLVGPKDDETGYPTMTVQDPRVAVVEPNPQFPTRSLAGLRLWEDEVINKIVTVLYLPDRIYVYHTPMKNASMTKDALTQRLLGSGVYGGGDLVGIANNELGECPLVRFSWRPDFTDLSFGEAEQATHIQDRINYMILDRIKIARDQAYQQRWAKSIQTETKGKKPDKGPVKPPFDMGSDTLWVTDNPEAEFGNFDAVDFKQILEAVRDDIADIAAISQTPAHYLMNRMVNVSGDTLTQSESGFVAKTKLRMEAMGWGWERCMKLAFKYMGDSKSTEVDANVLWADPEIRKAVDAADAASKWSAVGVPGEVLMERLGDFTPDQIEYSKTKIEEAKEAEAKMAQDQLAIQKTAAAQKPTAAKPAAKTKPAKK